MTPEKRVARAAHEAALARKRLELEIQVAREQGLSLRSIAKAADLSPEWVRQLAKPDPPADASNLSS